MARRPGDLGKVDNIPTVMLNLLRAAPRSTAEFIEALWGARDDGGPLWAEKIVHLAILTMRRQGVDIGRRGRRYVLMAEPPLERINFAMRHKRAA